MKTLVTIFCLTLCSSAFAQQQQADEPLVKGNEYYKNQQYDLAEGQYRLALQQNPKNPTAQYNLGSALYQQKKYDEAKEVWAGLAKESNNAGLKSSAYYNKGVAHTKDNELEQSIEAYKAALRLNPGDKEARENLQKALLEQKKRQQDQKQQNQQQKQNQSNMSQKQAEQKLKQLQEKEKELQQKMANKGQGGGSMQKDW